MSPPPLAARAHTSVLISELILESGEEQTAAEITTYMSLLLRLFKVSVSFL